MKPKNLILFILVLISNHVFSQEMSFSWSKTVGTSGNNSGKSIIADKSGYIYVAGQFEADFTYGDQTISGPGTNNIFIMKLDADGNFIWSKSFGSNGNALLSKICFDTAMNIICTGSFSATLLSEGIAVNSKGGNDIFILSLSPAGETIQVITDGGSGSENSKSVCVDKKNNIYICGDFTGISMFGNHALTSAAYWQYTPWGDSVYTYIENGFYAKYNSLHECSLAKQVCRDRSDLYSIISDNDDNIYTTGFFESFKDLTDTLAAETGNFLVFKYDGEGKLLNLIQEGSTNNFIKGNSLAIDSENNLLVAGYIGCHDCIFGDSLLPLAYNDAFLIKYDHIGNMKWINLLGQYNGDYDGNENSAHGIVVDKNDNIILTGYFDAIVINNLILIGNNTSIDYMVVKIHKNGSITNIGTFGYPAWDTGEAVTIDTANNIYFTGSSCFGTMNLDPAYIFIAKIDSMPTLGMGDIALKHNISIYPNPSQGSFYIDMSADMSPSAIISVSNLEGKILYQKVFQQSHNEVILNDYKPGLYIVKIRVGNMNYVKKIIIG